MENIQNTSEVVIAPKKTNIYKILFFICLLIIIGQIVCIYLIINKYKTNQNLFPNETETSTITPTNDSLIDLKAYSKLQNGTNNLILIKDDEETIIDSLTKNKDDQSIPDEFIRFENIKFSKNFRYLTYEKIYSTVGTFNIYDIQNKTHLKNFMNGANFIITDDEKNLIYCQSAGEAGFEGQIFSLPSSNLKFDFVKYLGNKITDPEVNCGVNNGKVIFSYNGNQELSYDLATSEIK